MASHSELQLADFVIRLNDAVAKINAANTEVLEILSGAEARGATSWSVTSQSRSVSIDFKPSRCGVQFAEVENRPKLCNVSVSLHRVAEALMFDPSILLSEVKKAHRDEVVDDGEA